MQKVDLRKVLEMLVNEEQDGAEGLLRRWFVEKTKAIHEDLMQQDDILETEDLTQGIEDDQDEIKSEEFYGEDIGDEDEVDALASDEADPEKIGSDDALGDPDTDTDTDPDVPDEEPDLANVTQMSTDPDVIQDQFADLQADLSRLKAEFAKITGGDDETPEAEPEDNGELSGELSPAGEVEDTEESAFTESDFADLDESFELEPVPDAGMTSSRYSGTGGKSGDINDRSPLPQNKPDARVGGKAVEIRSDVYKGGMDRQESPKVVNAPLRKNQVKNAADDLEAVGSLGPKNALLNKKDPTNDEKSLIGSGAFDLRGNTFKRK